MKSKNNIPLPDIKSTS